MELLIVFFIGCLALLLIALAVKFWYVTIILLFLLWLWETKVKGPGYKGKFLFWRINISSYQEDYDARTRPLSEEMAKKWDLMRDADDPPSSQMAEVIH